jgi:uncharacterized membrane protein YccC
MAGTALAAVLAAIVKFALLPQLTTFAGFSLALSLCLVPAGALMTQQWQTAMFSALAFNLVPLLAPANQMSYDPEQFYNAALAIVVGTGVAAFSFRLLPPLSPALRTRRLLGFTLRDLRRLARGSIRWTPDDWAGHGYARLAALPEQALPLQRAQLLAAISVGTEIIRLRRLAPQLGLRPCLEALAQGDSAGAIARLGRLDRLLAAHPAAVSGSSSALRARGSMLAIAETLAQHRSYFDAGARG